MTALGDALLIGAMLAAVTFVVVYARRSPWRATPMGRNVMALMGLIGLMLGLAAATAVFGIDFPFRATVRAGCFAALNAVLWHRVALLLRTQHEKPAPDIGGDDDR